jgi:uncharacterized membrane protein YphA (DoxX/SURF4 family)
MRKAHIALWTLQALLALFFVLGSGAPKLLVPADQLPMPIPLPTWLLYFIGTCEILGGLGLVLPGLTKRYLVMTPVAAVCLAALTICAAIYQLTAGQPGNAFFALVMGALCGVVAYGRRDFSRAAAAPTTPGRDHGQATLLA